MGEPEKTKSSWTRNFYPREGDATGFDRVIFFSDAVFAIALTLMAVEIGIPEIEDGSSTSELFDAILHKSPQLAAFVVGFVWVAIYWRANHRFTGTLRGMNGRYIIAVLVYLGFVAFLPFPSGLLGEYGGNAVAVSFFAIFAAIVSALEVVLLFIADRDGLFRESPSRAFFRQNVAGSSSPVLIFLLSIPIAFFVGPVFAIIFWPVAAVLTGITVGRLMPASPPASEP
ncbi:MAG: TMEM175 family protein [Candidatus Nanopelagicales bacterium]